MIEQFKQSQISLFNTSADEILKRFNLKPAIIEGWFKSGYLSFNPFSFDELNTEQEIEVEFIASLFNSGLKLSSINALLDKLEKPYRYDLRNVYFNFLKNDWEYLPRHFRDNIFDTIDELYNEDEIAELEVAQFKIGELIEEYYEENEDEEEQKPYEEDIIAMEKKVLEVPFNQFWYGSKILKEVNQYDDSRIIRALVIRHYYLENKEARSCHVLRLTIKSIEGPYFNTLWDLIRSDQDDEKWGASEILGEVGGAWSFQKILNILRREETDTYEVLLSCLNHVLNRYEIIRNDDNPTIRVMDAKSGEMQTVEAKDFNPELYDRILGDKYMADEYFAIPAQRRVYEMTSVLKKISPEYFPESKTDLIKKVEALI